MSPTAPLPPASPGPPAATTLLTDDAVDRWLAKQHPETARLIRRESQLVRQQQDSEWPLEGPSSQKPGLIVDTLPCTPIAELAAPPKHWAAALYPGSGSLEICGLVAPLLTAREGAALRMQFAEGKTQREIGEALGGMRQSNVCGLLKAARVKLYKAAKAGALPAAPEAATSDPAERLSEIERLLRETPTVYKPVSHSRPKRRAWVCDCGHHLKLTSADLDHRRVDPSAGKAGGKVLPERLFRCPHCGKTYTESDWPNIRA